MRALPNTTVDLLGGTSTPDQYGDHDESESVMAEGVPASLIEKTMPTVSTESDMQAVIVRYYVCRVPQGTPVTDLSRVRDRTTGEVFVVDSVTLPRHPVTPMDIRLDLRRVS
jgi:hypothetical protein